MGCKPSEPSEPVETRAVFDPPAYAAEPIDPDTRIFLVAGGADVANFAAEVLEQRRLWLDAGLRPEQIACYWAAPGPAAYQRDAQQYDRLADALSSCRAARPGRLLSDLEAIASTEPEWIYLYVTAHGTDSLLDLARRSRRSAVQAFVRSLTPRERALLDQHAIGLDAAPATVLQRPLDVVQRLRAGDDARSLVFTPAHLRDALHEFGTQTRKIIVLQACYSGGFVVPDPREREGGPQPTLTELPNLVAIAAAAPDRPSFGCASGQARTYFGAAINQALARSLSPGDTPVDLDWPTIFERTVYAVDVMEAVEGTQPSGPTYFSNVEPAGESR